MDVVALQAAKAYARPGRDRTVQGHLVRGVPVLSNLNTMDRQSNGTDTGGNYRRRSVVAADTTDLRFVYGNFFNNENTAQTNAITVRAAVMSADGLSFWPVYFGGLRDVTIQPGQTVTSDPMCVFFTAGTALAINTYVTVSSGGKWPMGPLTNGGASPSEFSATGTTQTDSTTTFTTPSGAGTARQYGPLAVFGTTAKLLPSVALIGDSITNGSNDTYGISYAQRALNDAIPYVQASMGGENGYEFFGGGAAGTVNQGRLRRQLVTGVTHAIEGYGHNDFNAGKTLAFVQAALIKGWRSLAVRGIKTYRITLTPMTTSTDSWATTTNQTVTSWESNRVAFNTWIRDGAPMDASYNPLASGSSAAGTIRAGMAGHPLAGYFETADTVETARNSGIWKVAAGTTDGTHPGTAGHTLMAAAVDVTKFTV